MMRPTRIRVSLLARGTGAVRRAVPRRRPRHRASSHGARRWKLPAGAAMAEAEVPAQALLRLQSSDARDLRVFNAGGEAVPFALMEPVRASAGAGPRAHRQFCRAAFVQRCARRPPVHRARWRFASARPAASARCGCSMDGADVAGAPRLDSVLFATKDEKRVLSGIEVQATLPANTPVRMAASSSEDLAHWSPVPVRGRLYRFEGAGAPVNMTLEFERPVLLEGRYLRLDWSGQQGVAVTAVTGLVAPPAPAAARVRGELPAPQGRRIGRGGNRHRLRHAARGRWRWPRPAAMPCCRCAFSAATSRRSPGGCSAQTVVYRLGTPGSEAVNPPVALHGASARWLRIESTSTESDLAAAQLQASAEFQPVRLVFVASGSAPFELAAGRSQHRSCRLAAADPRRDPGHAQGRRPARGDGGHAGDPGGGCAARWRASGPAARAPARPPCFGPCCWPACCCWARWPGRCCGN